MLALDHAAVAAGEFEQSTGERPGDAEGIGHRRGAEPQQIPGGDRGTKRVGGTRRVKAACLIGVSGRASDADAACVLMLISLAAVPLALTLRKVKLGTVPVGH